MREHSSFTSSKTGPKRSQRSNETSSSVINLSRILSWFVLTAETIGRKREDRCESYSLTNMSHSSSISKNREERDKKKDRRKERKEEKKE